MKTLTYWFARHIDSPSYNIRRLTKKACQEAADEYGGGVSKFHAAPKKVTVSYSSPLDLLDRALCEGGGIEY